MTRPIDRPRAARGACASEVPRAESGSHADVRNLSAHGPTRRNVLRGLFAGAGLVLGVGAAPAVRAAMSAGASAATFEPNIWIALDASGALTLVAHRSEMGTGIRTALPMALAEELRADWSRVTLEQAIGSGDYGSQNTDGSRSVRQFLLPLRRAGAAARVMLERAAAERWGVDASECEARDHAVHHADGRSLGFGELAADAARQPVPDDAPLTPPEQWRYLGKGVPLHDGLDLVTGRATFGLDVRLENMLFATIERCPVLGGQVSDFDPEPAFEVDGVKAIHEIPRYLRAPGFEPVGGVAVLADSTAAALQGRRRLDIEWDLGPNASYDSDTYREGLAESVSKPGQAFRDDGDVDAALADAHQRIEAVYHEPHLAHAPMEPPCATARFADGKAECWAPTQNPQAAQAEVARALGIQPEDVTIHVTLLGGGFGRKSKPDYVVEAALLAALTGRPVQLVWTREDDIRHDYFHAVSTQRMEAGLDERGKVTAWLGRSAYPDIGTTWNPAQTVPGPGGLGLGFLDVPYAIDNLRVEACEARAHVRIGWFRSVCNVFHAFAVCSFADEIAAARGRDPLDNLRELLGADRHVDMSGIPYGNYGESPAEHPLDTRRLKAVLEAAAAGIGWGRSLPRGKGLGIAVHYSFAAFVACACEVEVSPDGALSIPRVVMAADCGFVLHPDRVRAQMEGAAVFGTSLALFGAITAKDGAIVQSNFHDYPMARMASAPKRIDVELLVDNDTPPAGAGEPGVPPVAPALANAIFAATGQRVRSLPFRDHDLSWS